MSVPAGQVRCHGCQFATLMSFRPVSLRYHLPSGETVDRHRVISWCIQCEGFRDVEPDLDANSLQYGIDELLVRKRSLGGFVKNALRQATGGKPDGEGEKLIALTRLLQMAKLRRSRPRCLNCGSEDVQDIEFDAEGTSTNYIHHCGGRLFRVPTDPDAPRFAYAHETIELDVEGRRLKPLRRTD